MTPALSYVIPCGAWRHADRVVGCLLEQEEAGRIELVLAGPRRSRPKFPPDVRDAVLGRHGGRGRPARDARGPRRGSPRVARAGRRHRRDALLPAAGWARAFIDAFASGDWDGIGPQIVNANPATGLSWANLALDYGPFLRPQRGETDVMPGQNAGVRTAVLEPYRADLGEHMRMPYLFFQLLREDGARFFLEPGARSAHLNVTDRRAWLGERFGAGRMFANERAAQWPRWRRIVYTVGSPAIPLLRLRRALARPSPRRRTAPRRPAAGGRAGGERRRRGGGLCRGRPQGPAVDLRDRTRS